eukprot:180331-Prymnesium_polylepis.2
MPTPSPSLHIVPRGRRNWFSPHLGEVSEWPGPPHAKVFFAAVSSVSRGFTRFRSVPTVRLRTPDAQFGRTEK